MSNASSHIKNPSIDITVNFLPNQKEICCACYNEVCNIYHSFFSIEDKPYNIFDSDGVDFYSDGWYFNICISLKETELIKTIIEKIAEYKPAN